MSSGTGANSRMLSPASLSSSSFQFIASDRHSQANDSSEESFSSVSDATSSDEDEIVWSISDLSASVVSRPTPLRSPDVFSDEEYIVLSPPMPRPLDTARTYGSGNSSLSASIIDASAVTPSVDGLSDVLSNLNIDSDVDSVRPVSQATNSRARRRLRRRSRANVAAANTAPVATAAMPKPRKKKSKTKVKSTPVAVIGATMPKKKKAKAAKAQPPSPVVPQPTDSGLGERPIVDDVSEAGDVNAAAYEEAVQYISSFLSAPAEGTKAKSNLTFLQALIIELGLLPAPSSSPDQSFYHLPSLPRSLKAAKTLLKTNVFLNVRDYLDVREKGLQALRSVMHPSRKALIKDLSRGKGQRKVPRGFVKNSGLGVLLVACYH